MNSKMSLLSSGPLAPPSERRISSLPPGLESRLHHVAVTKLPYAALSRRAHPRPGPDLSDSRCLCSGCLGPRCPGHAAGQGGVENKAEKYVSPKTWQKLKRHGSSGMGKGVRSFCSPSPGAARRMSCDASRADFPQSRSIQGWWPEEGTRPWEGAF